MGHQNEITKPEPLHNEDGTLFNPGFARTPYQTYDRSLIKASRLRRKEWDYYLISDDKCALCLTIADLGYSGLYSVSLIDFGTTDEAILSKDMHRSSTSNKNKGFAAPEGSHASSKTTSVIRAVPLGKTGLPVTSTEGVSCFESSKVRLKFTVRNNNNEEGGDGKTERRLEVYVHDFFEGHHLTADITLTDEPRDSMVITTPFKERPSSFFYNRKIVGMRARGSFTLARETHIFSPDTSSNPSPDPEPNGSGFAAGPALGLLDWGRGVWTRDNTWYWAAAHGYHHRDGRVIGFNLGYGFGDTSATTENMFFVDGVAHKLDQVDFGIPDDNSPYKKQKPSYLKPWHFTSNDGRLDMLFTPIVDRIDYINLGLVVSDQHQIVGRCAGKVTLDNGSILEFENLLATAEKVRNKW